MKVLAALLLCLVIPAMASSKEEPTYQDGTLKDFKTVQQGQHCSTSGGSDGTVNAHTNDSGYTDGTINTRSSSSTNCSPNIVPFYTITVGEHEYVVTPHRAPFSNSPLVMAFHKNSDLSGVLPGTVIKVRTEGENFYVKIGKRESIFKLVSAR